LQVFALHCFQQQQLKHLHAIKIKSIQMLMPLVSFLPTSLWQQHVSATATTTTTTITTTITTTSTTTSTAASQPPQSRSPFRRSHQSLHFLPLSPQNHSNAITTTGTAAANALSSQGNTEWIVVGVESQSGFN
jgi:hypothetical protein